VSWHTPRGTWTRMPAGNTIGPGRFVRGGVTSG
jgi:hypothetical protein